MAGKTEDPSITWRLKKGQLMSLPHKYSLTLSVLFVNRDEK